MPRPGLVPLVSGAWDGQRAVPIPTVSVFSVTCVGHMAPGAPSSVIPHDLRHVPPDPAPLSGETRAADSPPQAGPLGEGLTLSAAPASVETDTGLPRAESCGQRTMRTTPQTPAGVGSAWCPQHHPECPFLRVSCARRAWKFQCRPQGRGSRDVNEPLDTFVALLPAFGSGSLERSDGARPQTGSGAGKRLFRSRLGRPGRPLGSPAAPGPAGEVTTSCSVTLDLGFPSNSGLFCFHPQKVWFR